MSAAGSLTVAIAGDTMLGRGVAEAIDAGHELIAGEVAELAAAADLFVVNLECCISRRGERWQARGKPFFFRAPPRAAQLLAELGVDAVTLANNHTLDFGETALLDTLEHLDAAGIAHAGAGGDENAARAALVLEARGGRLALVSVCDHAADFAAGPDLPGIAYADLGREPLPAWLAATIEGARRDADAVLVSPHWGPNMVPGPVARVRRCADALQRSGVTLVAGHSAHVPHGAAGRVLYDLGDFVDDYAVDARLRNDLGLLFRVELRPGRPTALEAFPLKLEFCHTRLARDDEAAWILDRFAAACAALGARPAVHADRVTLVLGA
jgi:poly-gamma-glutamate capsule biosynthesis protein CapA/YwtB (metallophosphatase superfamily)